MPASTNSESTGNRHMNPDDTTATNADDLCINILLVDDDPKNLTVLETILEDPGYRLVRADSANQALLALVREEFALIVLDIQLPGMSGFELAQMIKQRKRTAGVPIIFLTAYYSESEHVLEGYGSGAVDYLHKPVNAAILRSKVAVFAALYRTTKQTERVNNSLLAEVAERRRIEEQLLELNNELEERVEQRTAELLTAHRRKDEFLATLAHELRNPLAPIRNALEILTLSHSDPETSRQITEMMGRQVNHLVRLVDDLLDVSRVMGGKIELRKERIALSSITRSAVETVQPLITANRHKLVIGLPEEPVFINADPVRLIQVIANLLTNAAKYTEPEGTIQLFAEMDEREVTLHVRDTGIGISDDMLSRIFELFMQVDQTATRSQGGLGIGLTLVKNLVEMHQGTVTAYSEGFGKGSEFQIRLPVAAAADEVDAPLIAPKRTQPMVGHRLLVVDDNKAAATTLAMLLKLQGHDVTIAHDGMTALKLAVSFRPDIVFLDIGMPKMDGYQVAKEMRLIPGLNDVILVAVTGWGQQEDRRRTAEAGFNRHLVKPADLKVVEELLSELKPVPD